MPIYVREGLYGHRRSKYALNFRQLWSEEIGSGLTLRRNVATAKLVLKASYHANGADSYKGKGLSKYVTLPSLGFEGVRTDGRKGTAFNHSEKTIRQYLDDAGWLETYWLVWLYTERIPCDADHYEQPCDQFIKVWELSQLTEGGPPIIVYWSVGLAQTINGDQYEQTTTELSTDKDQTTALKEYLRRQAHYGASNISSEVDGEIDLNKAQARAIDLDTDKKQARKPRTALTVGGDPRRFKLGRWADAKDAKPFSAARSAINYLEGQGEDVEHLKANISELSATAEKPSKEPLKKFAFRLLVAAQAATKRAWEVSLARELNQLYEKLRELEKGVALEELSAYRKRITIGRNPFEIKYSPEIHHSFLLTELSEALTLLRALIHDRPFIGIDEAEERLGKVREHFRQPVSLKTLCLTEINKTEALREVASEHLSSNGSPLYHEFLLNRVMVLLGLAPAPPSSETDESELSDSDSKKLRHA